MSYLITPFILITKAAKKKIEKRHLRSRQVSFQEGQEVFRRNHQRSNFAEGFMAKLAPTLRKAGIGKKRNNYYVLENMQGNFMGKYCRHEPCNEKQEQEANSWSSS